jgi:hypothetical protein
MGIFSTPRQEKPKPTPVTPRLSDTELKARDESEKLKKRAGVEDNILSLGRAGTAGGTGDRQVRYSSLLGRAGQ